MYNVVSPGPPSGNLYQLSLLPPAPHIGIDYL